jgi:exonuclease VII small subunit
MPTFETRSSPRPERVPAQNLSIEAVLGNKALAAEALARLSPEALGEYLELYRTKLAELETARQQVKTVLQEELEETAATERLRRAEKRAGRLATFFAALGLGFMGAGITLNKPSNARPETQEQQIDTRLAPYRDFLQRGYASFFAEQFPGRDMHGKFSHEETLLLRQFDRTQRTKLRAAQEIVSLLESSALPNDDGISALGHFPRFGKNPSPAPSPQSILEQALQKTVTTYHLDQAATEELRTVFSEFIPTRSIGGTHG